MLANVLGPDVMIVLVTLGVMVGVPVGVVVLIINQVAKKRQLKSAPPADR